jgi:hypothetical protein
MAELDIYGICQTCKEEHAIEDIKLTCEWCVEETPIREAIKECFTKISFIKDFHDDNFESPHDKEVFMKGLNHGYHEALFWIADYFDLTDIFEQLSEKKKIEKPNQ